MPSNPVLTATDPANPDLLALLKACQTSAVHLEMRDVYAVPGEAEDLAAWRAGRRLDPADPSQWWTPWLDALQAAAGRGVELRRARVVSEPLSEYSRFLRDETFPYVAAGEATRWLPRRLASDLLLPGNDFWVFDGTVVIWNYFSGDGVPMKPRGWSDEPEHIELCTGAFEAVWERGIDHVAYLDA